MSNANDGTNQTNELGVPHIVGLDEDGISSEFLTNVTLVAHGQHQMDQINELDLLDDSSDDQVSN